MEQGLAAGVHAGFLNPIDVRMTSEAIVGMVAHVVRIYFTDPTLDEEEVINTLARSTIGILRSMSGMEHGSEG